MHVGRYTGAWLGASVEPEAGPIRVHLMLTVRGRTQ
jgi:hypothetical protein